VGVPDTVSVAVPVANLDRNQAIVNFYLVSMFSTKNVARGVEGKESTIDQN
jgi:hypothetical protein